MCLLYHIHPTANIARGSFPVPLRILHLKCRLRSGPRHSLILPINLKIPLKSQNGDTEPGALLHFKRRAAAKRAATPELVTKQAAASIETMIKATTVGACVHLAGQKYILEESLRGAEKIKRCIKIGILLTIVYQCQGFTHIRTQSG